MVVIAISGVVHHLLGVVDTVLFLWPLPIIAVLLWSRGRPLRFVQAVVTVADLLMLTVMVFVTVTIVAGFAVLMLHGFGHEPECACGCPAEPSSDAVMCGQCEQEAQTAAGMCRLISPMPAVTCLFNAIPGMRYPLPRRATCKAKPRKLRA